MLFAAIEKVREAAIKRLIFPRRSAHTNTRQKALSDHNYLFPQLQLSHINKGSVGVLLVMRRRPPLRIFLRARRQLNYVAIFQVLEALPLIRQ